MKLAVAGQLTLFVTCTRRPAQAEARPARLMPWPAVGTKIFATLIVAFGLGLVSRLPWSAIGFAWGYCFAWFFVNDSVKLVIDRHLHHQLGHQGRFLKLVKPGSSPAPKFKTRLPGLQTPVGVVERGSSQQGARAAEQCSEGLEG